MGQRAVVGKLVGDLVPADAPPEYLPETIAEAEENTQRCVILHCSIVYIVYLLLCWYACVCTPIPPQYILIKSDLSYPVLSLVAAGFLN